MTSCVTLDQTLYFFEPLCRKGENLPIREVVRIKRYHSHSSFTQQKDTKHLLCARCCSRHWGHRGALSLPSRVGDLVVETDTKQISQ